MFTYEIEQEIKKSLQYNPETGEFIRLKCKHKSLIGKKTGRPDGDGYYQISFNSVRYGAHRLAFVFMGQECPDYVDHINGNPSDNRWINLRPCTVSENMQNSKIRKTNSSGIKNVSWDKRSGKWVVQLRIDKKKTHLGYYESIELDELVASEARDKFFAEFSRHE